MKKFLHATVLTLSIAFSFQSKAIFMPGDELGAAMSVTTCFPTILLSCIGGECGFKELNVPALEKEALEVLSTGNDLDISSELSELITKIKSLEPKYKDLTPVEVLRKEYIKGQKIEE